MIATGGVDGRQETASIKEKPWHPALEKLVELAKTCDRTLYSVSWAMDIVWAFLEDQATEDQKKTARQFFPKGILPEDELNAGESLGAEEKRKQGFGLLRVSLTAFCEFYAPLRSMALATSDLLCHMWSPPNRRYSVPRQQALTTLLKDPYELAVKAMHVFVILRDFCAASNAISSRVSRDTSFLEAIMIVAEIIIVSFYLSKSEKSEYERDRAKFILSAGGMILRNTSLHRSSPLYESFITRYPSYQARRGQSIAGPLWEAVSKFVFDEKGLYKKADSTTRGAMNDLMVVSYLLLDGDSNLKYANAPSLAKIWREPYQERRKDREDQGLGSSEEFCNGCGRWKVANNLQLRQCSRCQVARFCSIECQTKGWSKHKLVCFDAKVPYVPNPEGVDKYFKQLKNVV